MPKSRGKSASSPAKKLNRRQVIDSIMKLIACAPEVGHELPAAWKSRKHWERTFSPRNKFAAPVLEVLQELPGFTNLAPRSGRNEDWNALFSVEGIPQVARILADVAASANFKPIHRSKIRYWRAAYGKDEVVQRVRPRESFDYIHNPHRGTTTFQRFQGDDLIPTFTWHDRNGPLEFEQVSKVRDNVKFVPRTTLTYCRWPWEWLEPQKGKFNWAIIEQTLKTARARGQTAQLRFQPYTISIDTKNSPPKTKRFPPEVSVDVPPWYWETGAPWIDQGPFGRNEPDCNDPRYLEHFGEFVRAFGRQFDGHPDLESIDIAYAGFWGEAGGNTTEETARKLTDIYLENFQKTQLLGMLGTPGMKHAVEARSKSGMPIGWRADSFGDYHIANVLDVPEHLGWNHMMDAYAQEVYEARAIDAWKTAPVTMESSAAVPHWVMQGYDVDRIIEEGYNYHTTVFMPKSAFFPEKIMDKLLAFDRKIGYRFVLRQLLMPLKVRRGGKFSANVFAVNVGCAPIYRPYKLALRFKQGRTAAVVRFQEDIRRWLPGHNYFREELQAPPEIEKGEVEIALGIVDESNTPRVWFAIDGKTDQGWHPLTNMEISD